MKILFLETDVPNRNGRKYSLELIANLIKKEEFKTRLKNDGIPGYMGQSSDTNKRSLEELSHITRDIYIEGNKVFAEVEFTDTPSGRFLKKIIEQDNEEFGMAMKGYGDIKQNEDGVNMVNSLELVSIDYVYNPSWKK